MRLMPIHGYILGCELSQQLFSVLLLAAFTTLITFYIMYSTLWMAALLNATDFPLLESPYMHLKKEPLFKILHTGQYLPV